MTVDLGHDQVDPDTDQPDVPDGMVHFGQVEFDLLATHAGVPAPFPLRVPSFGRIAGERQVLLAAAGQTLRMRGLADLFGPLGDAAELVTALREYRGAVDLVLAAPDETIGVVALVYRTSALICRQRVDGDLTDTIGVRRVPETVLTAELAAMVPDHPAARSMPIALPNRAVSLTLRALAETPNIDDLEHRLRDLVRDCGGDPTVLDQLAALLPTLHGRGQAGATSRSGAGAVREGTELSWLDGPSGRVRVSGANEGWVSVNPVHDKGFRAELDDIVATARGVR